MARQVPEKIIYYQDPLNDDFAENGINTQVVDKNFKFIHKNPLWRFCSFLIYYLVAVPLVWFYTKVLLGVRFVNVKAVKPFRKVTYYLYGNHTGFIDAFIPNLISLPRRNKILVSPDTVSIKGLKNLVQMLGALPVPSAYSGTREFLKALDYYHKNYNVTVYPEAHIWPYYTGVRPFKDSSFAYPIKHNAPVFAFFVAYSKPSGFLSCFRKANVTVYVSDAIFPDEGLTGVHAKKNIRDKVYAFMVEKSKNSNYEVVKYVQKANE